MPPPTNVTELTHWQMALESLRGPVNVIERLVEGDVSSSVEQYQRLEQCLQSLMESLEQLKGKQVNQ